MVAPALLLGVAVIADVIRELRHRRARLARTPVWTVMLILTIALGIASNASVDGFVRGLAMQEPLTPEGAEGIARIGGCCGSRRSRCSRSPARTSRRFFSPAHRRARVKRRCASRSAPAGSSSIRQVLADSLLISIAGAAAGAILAFWIGQIVPSLLFEEDAQKMIFAADPSALSR